MDLGDPTSGSENEQRNAVFHQHHLFLKAIAFLLCDGFAYVFEEIQQ